MTRWAFAVEPGLVRMEIVTLLGNDASGRVAIRAGFVREGVLRRTRWALDGSGSRPFRGELVDAVMFARLRDDPES